MNTETIEKRMTHTVVPAVNIRETPVSFIVSLDIPGAVKENINAAIENNTLLVTAETGERSDGENGSPAREFRREFSLANDIDLKSIDAAYNDGVLTIILTKKTQYSPQKININ
ncbi:MAG: Hsp20/alpha crystallin family protein [Bacteroidota bacterium]